MINYNEMRTIITGIDPGDTVDYFDKAIRVFNLYQFDLHIHRMVDTYGRADALDYTDAQLLECWKKDIRESTQECLNQQGIALSVNSDLAFEELELLESVFMSAYHEDRLHVGRILESDMPDEEVFAELCSICGELSVEKILVMVESIPLLWRDAMKEAYAGPVQEEPVSVIDGKVLAVISGAYRKFKSTSQGAVDCFADQMVKNVSTIGLLYKQYVELFLQQNYQLDENNWEQSKDVAAELFGLACLSQDGVNNPIQTVMNNIGLVYADLNAVARINAELRLISSEFTHA